MRATNKAMPKNSKKPSKLTATIAASTTALAQKKWSSTLHLTVPLRRNRVIAGSTPNSHGRESTPTPITSAAPQSKRVTKPRDGKKKKTPSTYLLAKTKKKPEQKTMFTKMKDASIKYGRLRKVPGGAAGSQKR
jgi:hypothetical protein